MKKKIDIEVYKIIERRTREEIIKSIFGSESFNFSWLNPLKPNSLLKEYEAALVNNAIMKKNN